MSPLKEHEGYFGMDLLILSRGQMTSTPELAPHCKLPHHTSGRTFDPRRQIRSTHMAGLQKNRVSNLVPCDSEVNRSKGRSPNCVFREEID
ncbi:hypothetical protein AVEN_172417-1 [Araneus ventricosus]|uniref:Uncharacterized protein n=1 Tax=Araneus ventricosus TaxID=182803 RepID=A0A4Y2RG86_ARAVE|nr:hypothetical protein AVEN_172417-1 [Araneus ventricosus]